MWWSNIFNEVMLNHSQNITYLLILWHSVIKVRRYQWGHQKEKQYNGQRVTKGQTMNYKTLHRKLKIEPHESHSGAPVSFKTTL